MILDDENDSEVFENNSDRGGDSCDNAFDSFTVVVYATVCSE